MKNLRRSYPSIAVLCTALFVAVGAVLLPVAAVELTDADIKARLEEDSNQITLFYRETAEIEEPDTYIQYIEIHEKRLDESLALYEAYEPSDDPAEQARAEDLATMIAGVQTFRQGLASFREGYRADDEEAMNQALAQMQDGTAQIETGNQDYAQTVRDQQRGSITNGLVIGGIAGAVVVGGGVAFMMMRKKAHAATSSSSSSAKHSPK